jgi:hypothetical protein
MKTVAFSINVEFLCENRVAPQQLQDLAEQACLQTLAFPESGLLSLGHSEEATIHMIHETAEFMYRIPPLSDPTKLICTEEPAPPAAKAVPQYDLIFDDGPEALREEQ